MLIDAKLTERLERFGQHHVLQLWNQSNDAEQMRLSEQLSHVDWHLIETYLSGLSNQPHEEAREVMKVSSPAHVVRSPKNDGERQYWARARRLGEDALRAGKVAIVLLAGGQGTRLGFDHPKGMFSIGPVSGKSLFAIFAEHAIAVSERVGQPIPYLIMTSDGTHDETIAFFEAHDYFGLRRSDVFFFKQGYAPSLDAKTGKLLIADHHSLCMNPDGHGGLLTALLKAGLFEELRRRGIEIIFTHQVDNPLTQVCDPAFIGLHIQNQADVSTKVVSKIGPEEKVGVAVDLNGRTAIIEYSDLSAELAHEYEPNGGLRYWAGNTAIHVFDREFLERIATSVKSLPWHQARKKVPYVDSHGQFVHPEFENGVKFERFLFDTMPLARTALIVETIRSEEFAPLKNSTGDFSPEYVRQQMIRVATSWLAASGITVPASAVVEISPRFALSAEELAGRVSEMAGLDFDHPVYLAPNDAIAPKLDTDTENIGDAAIATMT